MQLRSIAMALVRLVLALSLVAVLAPLGSHEAVAGRFGSGDSEPAKDGDGEKASSATAAPAKGGANTYSAEELRARAEARARAEEEQANAPPAPPVAAVVKVVKPAPVVRKDAEVAGCAPGKLCIVCVAGCNGTVNGIVHAAPKAAAKP